MTSVDTLRDQTVNDFGDQWSKYTENEGYYGSVEMLIDILGPLVDIKDLQGAVVAEIGSGTGRIVSMLLDAGVKHVYAVEPSEGAFGSLKENIKKMERGCDVTAVNALGHEFELDEKVDYIFSIGVVHHIPDPKPVIEAAKRNLKEDGRLVLWLYGYEGNEFYIRIFDTLRIITTRLPHALLNVSVWTLYFCLIVYYFVGKIIPVPLYPYIKNVLWPMTPANRRLVIYDQLNPAYAKYYKKDEASELLEDAELYDIKLYHRHEYSWSVIGHKKSA